MSTPADLLLLGLAEQLSGHEVSLGDPADESLLSGLLDRCTDAVVDVVQGRHTLSRPTLTLSSASTPTVGAPPRGRAEGSVVVDSASCSALAARCHRAAHLLEVHPDQTLASPVAACLRTVAGALQRLVQDQVDQGQPQARQRLRRELRRAAALLEGATPKVAP